MEEKDLLTLFIETLTKIRRSLNSVLSSQGDVVDGSISTFPSKISTIFASFENTFEKIGYHYNEQELYIPPFIYGGLDYAKELLGDKDELVLGDGKTLENDTKVIFLPKTRIEGTTAANMFKGCKNLLIVANMDVSLDVTSLESMFEGCQQLRDADGMKLKEGHKATTANRMFYGCNNIINIPDYVVQESCTNADSIFYGCASLGNNGKEVVRTATWNTEGLTELYLGGGNDLGLYLHLDTTTWDLTGCTIKNSYNTWTKIVSLVGNATPEEVDGMSLTAMKNFSGSINLNNLLASGLNQASLMALINGAATLVEGESRTWEFYNSAQIEKLGTYKDKYIEILTNKGWTIS